MVSDQTSYDEAFKLLKNAVGAPRLDFLASPEKYRAILENDLIPFLNNTASSRTVEANFQAWSNLVQLLPELKEVEASSNSIAKTLAPTIAINALNQLSEMVKDVPDHRLGDMLNDLRELAFYITADRDCDGLLESIDDIESRDPDIAKIPPDGHCTWFSGKSAPGDAKKDIPLEAIIYAAKYAHLHPERKVSLWTDDVHSVENAKHIVNDLLSYDGTPGSRTEDAEKIFAALEEVGISSVEVKAALKNVAPRPWQEIFREDWGDFPIEKKNILESTLINETNGTALLRHPGTGRDIMLMAAVAIKGGVAFDLDTNFNDRVEIFDAFGLQFVARERDQETEYDVAASFRFCPQVFAATQKSKAALRGLEKMADFFGSINRFTDKRGNLEALPREELENMPRAVLSYQVGEQPLHGMSELYGDQCYNRFFRRIASLALNIQTGAIALDPVVAYTGYYVNRDNMRRASDPGNLIQREYRLYKSTGIYADDEDPIKKRISKADVYASLKKVTKGTVNAIKKAILPSPKGLVPPPLGEPFTNEQQKTLKRKYPKQDIPSGPDIASAGTPINGGVMIGRRRDGAYLFYIPNAGKLKLKLVSRELMRGRTYQLNENATFVAGAEITQRERQARAKSSGVGIGMK